MNRRDVLRAGSAALLGSVVGDAQTKSAQTKSQHAPVPAKSVEQWGIFEHELTGPATGNPYLDHWLTATFRNEHREIKVNGFYDGEGRYLIRFMPDQSGTWTFATDSDVPEMRGKTGAFTCEPPSHGNHGPVSVQDTYHFAHADGTPYFPFGTTCYAWVHQSDDLQEQTLAMLKTGPFNKIRMCVFPKWYQYNHRTPPRFPFPRNNDQNDYSQFNPEFFRHIEKQIARLRDINVEADLILFHPYDHWGFQEMPAEVDDRYLRYVIARFASYRNVWWSLANEFDLMKKKNLGDWDRYAQIVSSEDPYSHLRSIHYSKAPYDYARVWCTHATVQDYAFDKAASWRREWRKPVIFDECMYEGNINSRWGNLSGEEMARRFWLCIVAGVYAGHGETYIVSYDQIENDEATVFWAHGGPLKGTSPARIAYLRQLVEQLHSTRRHRIGFESVEPTYYLAARLDSNEALLWYFDFHQPSYYDFPLPEKDQFKAEWIDPWNMKTTPVEGRFSGKSRVKLPGKSYQAILFRKV